MKVDKGFEFLWLGGPSSNIGIRIYEISKRLIKKQVFPLIIIQNQLDANKINLSYLSKLSPPLKIFSPLIKEYKYKILNYLRELIIKVGFFFGFIGFLPSKVKRMIKNTNDLKFIYSTGPPFYTHIFGTLLKKKTGIPLVIEYTDPYSFNPYRQAKYMKVEKQIDKLIERSILKSADIIVSLSPFLNIQIKDHFPIINEKPIISIEDGLNIKNVSYIEKNTEKISIIFGGKLYGRRKISPFLNILSSLKKEEFFQKIPLILTIYGLYDEEKLETIIKNLDIEDLVELKGLIPRAQLLDKIMESDLCLHIGEDIDYPTIAFKVYDYISCRRKILFLSPRNTFRAKSLEENCLGVILPLNNLIKAKEILKKTLIAIQKKQFNCTIDINKIQKFSWNNKAKEFLQGIVNHFRD